MKANSVVLGVTASAVLALLAACGSPAEPAAKGGLSLAIVAYSPMPLGSACQVSGTLQLPAAPATPPSNTAIGDALSDGKDGAQITCSVKGSGSNAFDVTASILIGTSALNTSFNLDSSGNGAGTMTIVRTSEGTTQSSDPTKPCTFHSLQTKAGASWDSFNCPVIVDNSSPQSTYCTVDGTLTLQNCKH